MKLNDPLARDIDALRGRIALLQSIGELGQERLSPEILDRTGKLRELAHSRLGHGTGNTVVALAGATGSGKSSLFNAVSGTDFATVGIRRPTTSEALAVVFGDGADELLNWLAVPQRRRIDPAAHNAVGEALDGLVLLDLPDHDSTESANRAEVERLVQVVDVFVWVVDPQKYADAALHDNFLQRFAGHAAVTIVVLNQVDRLSPADRKACIDDLTRLLVDDGLRGVRVLGVSTVTGEGIDDLRRELGARVAERRALVRRLDADVDWLASDLAGAVGDGALERVPDAANASLVEAATAAAGADAIAHAVERSYRHRASLAVGWPPVRWVRRLRADPLSRLGLGGSKRASGRSAIPTGASTPEGTSDVVRVRRTAIATDPVAAGRLAEALRSMERATSANLPEGPRAAIARTVEEAGAELAVSLDVAAGQTDLHVGAPGWWRVAGAAQWVATITAALGGLWLMGLFVLAWFRLPDPPMAYVGSIPLPTVMALGGDVVGLLVAILGRRIAAVGARRRARKARADLAEEVNGAVAATVIAPVSAELASLNELAGQVRRLSR